MSQGNHSNCKAWVPPATPVAAFDDQDAAIEPLPFQSRFVNGHHSPSTWSSLSSTKELPKTKKSRNESPPKPKRAKKRASSSSDQGKPKRPLSAYNLFFQEQRKILLAKLPVRPQGAPRRSHGKLGFKEMARYIGHRWKTLDAATKHRFDVMAAKEKKRYAEEMLVYRNRLSSLEGPAAFSRPVGAPISESEANEADCEDDFSYHPDQADDECSQYEQEADLTLAAPMSRGIIEEEIKNQSLEKRLIAELARKLDPDLMDKFIADFKD